MRTDSDPVATLAAYRLEHDLTFDELAAELAAARCAVPARVLHLALTRRLKTRPRETTLYKLRKFVDGIGRRRRPVAARKRRRRAVA